MKRDFFQSLLILLTITLIQVDLAAYYYNTKLPRIHCQVDEFKNVTSKDIVLEPELDKASVYYAEENGGPLTQAFLRELKQILTDEEYQELRIDIKCPRLVYGFSPSNSVWHCDFHFTRSQKDPTVMERPNADMEEDVRHFTLISSAPETEYWIKPSKLDFWTGQDWELLQNDLDDIINPKDIIKIPTGTIVEFYGNNIHRSRPHLGSKPIIRFFIRASLFPKGHRFYGKDFRNTVRHRFGYRTNLTSNKKQY